MINESGNHKLSVTMIVLLYTTSTTTTTTDYNTIVCLIIIVNIVSSRLLKYFIYDQFLLSVRSPSTTPLDLYAAKIASGDT